MWYVRECDKGGRVVMGVLRSRFCVDMIGGKGIYLFLVGLEYDHIDEAYSRVDLMTAL